MPFIRKWKHYFNISVGKIGLVLVWFVGKFFVFCLVLSVCVLGFVFVSVVVLGFVWRGLLVVS